MKQEITCPCGKKTEIPENAIHSNIGAQQNATGWFWIPFTDGKSIWLCKECHEKVSGLAAQIIETLNEDMIYLYTLLPKKERIKKREERKRKKE